MVNIPNTHERAQIHIKSLSRGDKISFFPYDFEFDDAYKPDWGTYDAFGRMDPIMTYKRTTRDVNLSFNVVAEDKNMALTNFKNLQTLIKCLYPTYVTPGSGVDSYIEKKEKLRQDKLEKVTEIEAQLNTMKNEQIQVEDSTAEQSMIFTTEDVAQSNLSSINFEISKIEQDITQANIEQKNEINTIREFGVGVIHKSPLFQISFMNLLRMEEHVIAITSFKHKMKFDAADTHFLKGIAIPGEFNINLSFKVLHTHIPGEMLNYGK